MRVEVALRGRSQIGEGISAPIAGPGVAGTLLALISAFGIGALIVTRITPEVTREQLVEQYKKLATRHSPEVIDYVSKLSNEEVNNLYRGKPAETITIADKKYYKTTLASIKGELDNYIGGVEKQLALPKA